MFGIPSKATGDHGDVIFVSVGINQHFSQLEKKNEREWHLFCFAAIQVCACRRGRLQKLLVYKRSRTDLGTFAFGADPALGMTCHWRAAPTEAAGGIWSDTRLGLTGCRLFPRGRPSQFHH